MRFIYFATALTTAILACNPNPQPIPPTAPDADCDGGAPDSVKKCPPCICINDAAIAPSVEARACANLASIGCSDGTASDCVATLQKVEASGKFRIDVPALTAAKTIAQARLAGAACK